MKETYNIDIEYGSEEDKEFRQKSVLWTLRILRGYVKKDWKNKMEIKKIL